MTIVTVERCGGCGYGIGWHDPETKNCPELKTKKFQPQSPPTVGDWREVLGLDAFARILADRPHAPETPQRPRVPARPPQGPQEYAPQAMKLGQAAGRLGWQCQASYWQGADGGQGCALILAKLPRRAVVTWSKSEPDGKTTGWRADLAYVWRIDDRRLPLKVNHTDMAGLLA
jgi:hypothetical protein